MMRRLAFRFLRGFVACVLVFTAVVAFTSVAEKVVERGGRLIGCLFFVGTVSIAGGVAYALLAIDDPSHRGKS